MLRQRCDFSPVLIERSGTLKKRLIYCLNRLTSDKRAGEIGGGWRRQHEICDEVCKLHPCSLIRSVSKTSNCDYMSPHILMLNLYLRLPRSV